MKRRLLSMLLALTMVVTMLPTTVLADDDPIIITPLEQVEETPAPEETPATEETEGEPEETPAPEEPEGEPEETPTPEEAEGEPEETPTPEETEGEAEETPTPEEAEGEPEETPAPEEEIAQDPEEPMMLMSLMGAMATDPYYTYTPINDEGETVSEEEATGYKVGLTEGFKAALNKTTQTAFEGWTPENPLPSPASTYNGKPVTSLSYLFSECTKITKLNLSNWDTSNITNLDNTFLSCEELTDINLTGWDTSKVQNMPYLFYQCYALKSIVGISDWDTSNVTNMTGMFVHCRNLTAVDLTGWDTSNVTKMNFMFGNCEKIKTINLSSFDTSNVADMSDMFYNCKVLTNLDISTFTFKSGVNVSYMFENAGSSLSGTKCNLICTPEANSFINSNSATMNLSTSYININEHTHSWSYSKSGSTITATCTVSGCNSIANLTIDASPREKTYNGNACAPVKQIGNWSIVDTPTITYEKTGSQSSTTTPPTNAGSYKVTVSMGNGCALENTFVIKKRAIDVTGLSYTREYNGSIQIPTTTSTKFKIVTNGFKDVGNYTINVRLIDPDNHTWLKSGSYVGESDQSVPFTITPKPLTATGIDATVNYPTYNLAQLVSPTVVVKDGNTTLIEETDYTLDFDPYGLPGYERDITITGIGNYSGTLNKKWQVKEATFEENVNYTINSYNGPYTGTAHEFSIARTPALGNHSVTFYYKTSEDGTYSTTAPTFTNAGTYTIWYKITAVQGYEEKTGQATLTITKAPLTPQITDNVNKTYDGDYYTENLIFTLVGAVNDEKPKYSSSGTRYDTADAGDNKTITWSNIKLIEGWDANYVLTATSTQRTGCVISKATLIPGIAGANTKVYDGTTNAPDGVSITLSDAVANQNPTATANFAYDNPGVGTNRTIKATGITLEGNWGDNYKLSTDSANRTGCIITMATPEVITHPTAKTLTYTGSAQQLVTAGTTSGGTLNYRLGEEGSWVTDIPTATNAGVYTVQYMIDGNSNYNDTVVLGSLTVTIGERELTPQITGTTTKVYDGNTTAPEGVDIVLTGAVNNQKPTATASFAYDSAPVGDDKIITASNITLTGTWGTNYKLSTTTVEKTGCTITRANQSATVTMTGYTYGATPSEPTTSGIQENAAVTYYYNTINSNSGGTVWNKQTPPKLNADTYYMYAVLAETDNYEESSTAPVPFTVAKAGGMVRLTQSSKVFDGNPVDSIPMETYSKGDVSYEWFDINGQPLENVPVVADTYNVKVTVAEDQNYKKFTTSLSSYTIECRPVTVTIEDATKTYGDPDPDAFHYTTGADDLVEGFPLEIVLSRTEGEEVAVYTISATEPEGTNLNYQLDLQDKGEFVITSKELIPSISGNTSKVYDGNTDVPTGVSITLSGAVGNDDVTATADFAYNSATVADANKITANNITLSGIKSGNYKLSTTTVEKTGCTITRANQSATVTMTGYTYGATPSEPTTSGIQENAAVTYYYNTSNSNMGGTAWNKEEPPALGANTYYMYAVLAKTDNYEGFSTPPVPFTVAKADGTVTNISDISKTYDSTAVGAPSFTCDSTTTTPATIEYKLKTAEDSAYSTTAPTDAGVYVVRVTVKGDDNYNEGFATKEFTISQCPVIITPDDKTKVYGDTDPTLTYTVSTLPEGCELNLITPLLIRTPGENVDSYNLGINLNIYSANPNYEITFTTDKTLTITKATLEIIGKEKSMTVGGELPPAECVITGYKRSDDISIFGTTPPIAQYANSADGTVAGTYAINVFGGTSQQNYILAYDDRAYLTVNPIIISFNANGAEGEMSDLYIGNVTDTLTENAFTRSGYAFTGWNTKANGTGDSLAEGAKAIPTIMADTTLYAQWLKETKNSISGKVNPGTGVKVELRRGGVTLAVTETDENGDYIFNNIEIGEYNVTAIGEGGRTKTELAAVTKKAPNLTVNITLPEENVSAEASVEEDAPNVLVDGLDEVAKNEEDEDGAHVTIELVIDSTVDENEEQAITETADAQTVDDFLDISIKKYVNGVLEGNITDTGDNVLEIIIPFTTKGRTNFSVYRYHGEGVDTFSEISARPKDSTDQNYADGNFFVGSGFVAVYSTKFSTYAIGYEEVKERPSITPVSDGSSRNNPKTPAEKTDSPEGGASPATDPTKTGTGTTPKATGPAGSFIGVYDPAEGNPVTGGPEGTTQKGTLPAADGNELTPIEDGTTDPAPADAPEDIEPTEPTISAPTNPAGTTTTGPSMILFIIIGAAALSGIFIFLLLKRRKDEE